MTRMRCITWFTGLALLTSLVLGTAQANPIPWLPPGWPSWRLQHLYWGQITRPSGIFGRVTDSGEPVEGYELQFLQGDIENPVRVWNCVSGTDGWYFISLGDEEDIYFWDATTGGLYYPGIDYLIQFDIDLSSHNEGAP